jgi:hypothetical protein
MQNILVEMGERAANDLKDDSLSKNGLKILGEYGEHAALKVALTRFCQSSAKPLVLVLDEIDALVGDTLISVLRQIRSGYPQRPGQFPSSIVLCGVRDVRDYRIHSGSGKEIITGGSAFNIKAKSLRMGDFVEDEVNLLLAQHTKETGQAFLQRIINSGGRIEREYGLGRQRADLLVMWPLETEEAAVQAGRPAWTRPAPTWTPAAPRPATW